MDVIYIFRERGRVKERERKREGERKRTKVRRIKREGYLHLFSMDCLKLNYFTFLKK